ncbi:MAG: succinate dehydrogenase/fumarate reductase iron-sulfur subunit [Nitriliruptoraceae bacterium]
MRLSLVIWRQADANDTGRFERYELTDISPEVSILELLDMLNAQLVGEGREPVAFDHDCREGICGSCGVMVDGQPHGPVDNTPACLQRARSFADGDVVTMEPFRAGAFPVIRDLVVDRSALDRIIASGGYISTATNAAPEALTMAVNKTEADAAMNHAACIGCGACVAACPNAAAQLFTGAKVAHLAQLPQGQVERYERVRAMVQTMEENFGSCTNYGECVPACPADIQLDVIALLNRDYGRSVFRASGDEEVTDGDRRGIPWLSRLRSGPWWQSDPDDRSDATR